MPAPKSTWKDVERRIAKEWGTTRTPLSGGNSGHTRSDTLHDKIFMEIKHRKSNASINLWWKTKSLAEKENKTPVVCLHKVGSHKVHYLIEEDHLIEVAKIYEEEQKKLKVEKNDTLGD